jgi:mannose/fructose/N-acetylgalactosamine-specific phosphotransferase system component IIC
MISSFYIAAAWAGLISLDFTGVGPWMVAQPMVCGPIFGYLLGQLAPGIILGGLVQLLWIDITPVGVGIPYDSTAVTLLAVYWSALPAHSSLSQIILALFIAVPFGFVFRVMDFYARRINTHIARRIEKVSDENLPIALNIGILVGLVWTWVRYAATYAFSMWAGQKLWNFLAYWPRMTWMDQGLTMAVIMLPVAGMGVALEILLLEDPEGRLTALRHFKFSRGPKEPV